MTPASTPADANRWLVLVAMTGSLSMIMLDQTVVTVALPAMTRELPLSPTGQQWMVNAYVLALAALVAFGGRLRTAPSASRGSSPAARRKAPVRP